MVPEAAVGDISLPEVCLRNIGAGVFARHLAADVGASTARGEVTFTAVAMTSVEFEAPGANVTNQR